MSDQEFEDVCRSIAAQIHQFIDDELDDASCDEIRAHLDACEQCMDYADLELALKALVSRCCRKDTAPVTLRHTIIAQLHIRSE